MPSQKLGLEIKFDHAKYLVYDDQTAHIKGKIHDQYVDTDTLIGYSFLHLEHTDGANFLMLNAMWKRRLLTTPFLSVDCEAKFGAGIVVPRSYVILFGQEWNHCFHNAGQIAGIEAGLRISLWKYWFIEPSVKGAFANYNKVLAIDDVLISHRFWTGMILLDTGFQFPMGKPSRNKIPQPAW